MTKEMHLGCLHRFLNGYFGCLPHSGGECVTFSEGMKRHQFTKALFDKIYVAFGEIVPLVSIF